MKLSVIIPVYDEALEIILRAVNSIKGQLYYTPSDVEIILSSDMPGRKMTLENVRFLDTDENKGPGVARQIGLNACHGEYVTFLDADDVWYNSLAYALFLKDVYWRSGDKIDIVKFPILEQNVQGEFHQLGIDSTWCFSKIYRKNFLVDNDICFRDDLRVHEDSWFVRYVELHNPRILNHGDMIYLWMYNSQSTVRRNNGEYWQSCFDNYLTVVYDLEVEKAKRGYDTHGDKMYNYAYAFANISRMDKIYAKKCIDIMRKYVSVSDVDVVMAQSEALAANIRAAENHQNLPQILPRITINQFAGWVKEGV